MPILQSEAKTQIARVDGGQNDTDQVAAAEDALSYVLDRLNRRNWKWMLRDNSGDFASTTTWNVVAGTSDYELPTGIRINGIHSIRLVSKNRTLQPTDMRAVDRIVRNQSVNGLTTHYAIFNPTAFSPATQDTQAGFIRLIRTPDYTADDDILIRYYERIALPGDGFNLDIPDQYRDVVIALARARYLQEKNAESGKTAAWTQIAEQLYQEMKEDDHGHRNEDQDVRLRSGSEQGITYGSDDLYQDIWSV